MRDHLKFRAWSNKSKSFIANGFHIIGETTLFDLLNQTILEDLDTIVITQTSTCQDKNGKEIYEGDIIKYNNLTWPTSEHIGTIEFFAGAFVCNWGDQTDDTLSFMMITGMEVIGNIFENADLMPKDIKNGH